MMFKKARTKVKDFLVRKLSHSQIRKLEVFRDWFITRVFSLKKEMVTPFGFRLSAESYVGNRLMQTGEYEIEEAGIMKKLMLSTEAFIDVGANVGFYTCMARSLGKHAIAVEPQPRNLRFLYANLLLNGWEDTEVYPLGLGKRHGLMPLYGASGPSASLIAGWAGFSKRFKQVIPIMTLDNVLGGRFATKRLLIKIDVEGAEYDVLLGAHNTASLSPRPIWFVEIWLGEYHPGGINPNYQAIFDFFWGRGYKAYSAYNEMTPVLADDVCRWIKEGRTETGLINYVFMAE